MTRADEAPVSTTAVSVRGKLGDIAASFALTLMAMLQGFAAVAASREDDWLGAAHFGVVALALGICALLSLLRGAPVAARTGWRPRAIAVIGNFAIIPLAAMPLTWRPDWLLTLTTAAILLSYGWVIWALLTLRRSFSIFPEARGLVTRGPYAIVRHPLYAAYILVYALVALPRFGTITLVIAMLGISAEVMRARNEEQVLRAAFPGYAAYGAKVPAFIPRLHRGSIRQDESGITTADNETDQSREAVAA